jgi:AbrB family looped-hinge helix DNA binding protein
LRACSRVSRKGLTTIPAWVRGELGIEEGDFLIWEVDRERGSISVRVVKNPLKLKRQVQRLPALVRSS